MAGASADLLSDGVSITLVTAQPGGADFLQQSLIARGTPALPASVVLVSDPDHALLVKDAGDIFVVDATDGSQAFMNQTYDMVQPALVVLDKATGATIPELTWSWKTMGLAANQVREDAEVAPGVELVAFRPVISDLRAAIQERRPVELAPVALTMAQIEDECKRYGDWAD